MPFNGAGVYSPSAADFPAVSGTLIQATKFNNNINDIATALSTCITVNGQSTITANIPFSGFYATNVGVRAIAGVVGAPGIAWNSEPSSGWYRIAANDYGLSIAGTKVQETVAASHTFSQHVLFSADSTYDIGALAATRARDFFLGRNATIGGTATIAGTLGVTGRITGSADVYVPSGNVVAWGSGAVYIQGSSAANTLAFVTNSLNAMSFDSNGNATIRGTLTASGVGPHAIGAGTATTAQLRYGGAFTGSSDGWGFYADPSLTPAANGDSSGLIILPTLSKAGAGTHANFSAVRIDAPVINAGAAALTNATTLKITAAPSVGTNQRALWVAAGASLFGGAVSMSSTLDATGNISAGSIVTLLGAAGAPTAFGGAGAGNLTFFGGGGASPFKGAAIGDGTGYDFSFGKVTGGAYTKLWTITDAGAVTMTGALTYGGVTLSNAVTGTGSMVLSASPTFTGTVTGVITEGTSVATTSGTAINFSSIPAGCKKVIVSLIGVSTNGTDFYQLQIGPSGGVATSGYLGASTTLGAGAATSNFTAGFGLRFSDAANPVHGQFILARENASTNTWSCSGVFAQSGAAQTITTAGSISLSGALSKITLTTSGGVNTFDAGEMNIQYEF